MRGPPVSSPFHLIRRAELASTNDEALRLLREGRTPLPFVVRCDRQTAGRGRRSNAWWSDAGSLTFTAGLDPDALGLPREREPAVALAAAVAVIDAAEGFGPAGRLGIRWPNDVEADGRKLGGILAERIETPGGRRLAVGIGLNVSSDLAAAPEQVRRMAASLAGLAGPLEADALFEATCRHLARVLHRLAAGDAELGRRWAALDQLRGRPVRIDRGGRILAGEGRGIDEAGALRVRLPDGREEIVRGGCVLRP